MLRSHYLHQLTACAKRGSLSLGKRLHAQIIKHGLHLYGPLPNSLIHMYANCGLLDHALQVFDDFPHRDLVSWASVLTAYNHAGFSNRALRNFPRMWKLDGLVPDHFVVASLVKACGSLSNIRLGKQVHARFVVSPFSDDDVVKSSLVDMYAKCGLVDDARLVFGSIGSKSPISWTAMVSGYARGGRKSDAIELFRDMPLKNQLSWSALISGLVQSGHVVDAFDIFVEMRRELGIHVDPFVLSSLVGAAANSSTLELGKQIHCLVAVLGFENDSFLANVLVDMYAKCSDVASAKRIFYQMPQRDVVTWTSIIVGTAQHGLAEEALALYGEMELTGVQPNEVTFLGLIYACSHVGLVDKGKRLFYSMTRDYGLKPSLQHYTCLLDVLSRSGHLDEAEKLLNTMPFEPDEPAWASLLSACTKHKNTQVGIRVADKLLSLPGHRDPSTYILLANIYASASMWEKVSHVRKLMSVMDFRKDPGYSCIEMGRESVAFHAGATSHPMKEELLNLLMKLDKEMRKRGYAPDTSCVLKEVEEHEKEIQLFFHSERLAVAYGLLRSVPGSIIRVTKNLRICEDCHTVMKLISSITEREIIVRDISRFHCFKDGWCSCGNFW